ncbi:uncharacterized protein F4822DRAFT_340753 [Hypoxylon trugodes]|uniref:uncharacterized protein n=1 Tax=Hypoxylon trugodes TaxID=326681 RepID=UPI0021A215B9|nr:uncharacterized protein F4822DRAFT_340753 [Hypoxylon trugodes]KAI1385302.1 hypothetical protein F4822DRAFT_340753 [Hypoxylon trugodes]
MLLQSTHSRDVRVMPSTPKAKQFTTRPNPSCSRGAGFSSPFGLGDGLCDIFSPRSSSSTPASLPSLVSERTLDTSVTTSPILSAEHRDATRHGSAHEHIRRRRFDDSEQEEVATIKRQPLTHTTSSLGTGASLRTGSRLPTTADSSANPVTPSDILILVRGGKLSLSTAIDISEKYQYWDLLAALKASDKTQDPEFVQANINQPRRHEIPKPNAQSTGRTAECSPTDAIRERFLQKITYHANMDLVFHSGIETNLHIFIDMSNIFIGFCDSYRISKGIPQSQRITFPHFSFKALSTIMVRGRYVLRKVLAGSTGGGISKDPRAQWPYYFLEAESLGYDMNIFTRVPKRRRSRNKIKRRERTPPDGHSDDSINLSMEGSHGSCASGLRNSEQGVDENIHLNMMTSMYDYMETPGTIVLATGDAAEAEFSDGFLEYVIRALNKGWKVELIAWKCSLSSSWTNASFLHHYGHQFRVILLDDFLGEIQNGDDIFQG